jgi:class 3 adenylate cyclase/tetratricopeptide (TPR) repeat protein
MVNDNAMRCTNCGVDNIAGAKFCNQCATPLRRVCPKCAHLNAPDAKFCAECAEALTADVSKSSKQPVRIARERTDSEQTDSDPTDGERKTVTALFADIKGSTELEQNLDPEEARAIVDPALKLMIDAVRRYDGYIVQSTGDGIFALFGAPVAHEDHPNRALYAALRMQEELRQHGSRLQAEGRAPVEIRVGVNTGEVVVRSIHTGKGQVEYTPIGHTTNLASRLQTIARTGSIVVSDATRKLCEGYFSLKPLGATKVKGVIEPVNVYEVTGLGPLRTRLQRSAGRGFTRFVGREREMDAMKAAAQQAKAGRGQIVAAVAEPGVGKSRLFYEFMATAQSGWMVLEAFSVSHGKASAYLPVIELLCNYFKISSNDDDRTRREKVAGRLAILDPSLESTRPFIFTLLGIVEGDEHHRLWEQNLDRLDEYLHELQKNDPLGQMDAQIRRRRTLDAIKRILLRESLNQPLMLIFEDLHWLDEDTQALLNLLADSIATARILLLVDYRPEYSHLWSNKTYYTQLRLDPLGNESADEMLESLLGDSEDLEPLKRLIIEKTEGNPFFMEEMVQVLLDDSALVRNGSVKLARPLSELKIPPTVNAILASRIDRLPADQKDLLQTLAVIGMEFRFGLIRKVVAKPEEELERILSALQLGEFIYEQPSLGEVEYTFKHALTHDVAYSSLLIERRRVLHDQIGAAFESLYGDNLDDRLAELAHHFARSDNPAKALEYCLRVVQQCVSRGSLLDAVAHFETGLQLIKKLPPSGRRDQLELDLRIAADLALATSRGWNAPEYRESSARQIALCKRPGIPWEKVWLALMTVCYAEINLPSMRRACEIGTELVALAEEHRSAEHLGGALYTLGMGQIFAGDFRPAAESLDRAIAIWDATPDSRVTQPSPMTTALSTFPSVIRSVSAFNLWVLGYPDQALEWVNKSTELALETGSMTASGSVHNTAMLLFANLRDYQNCKERAEAVNLLATELGNSNRRAMSIFYLAWMQSKAGDLDTGIDRMRQSITEMKATGSELGMDYFLALLATAIGRTGRFDEALHLIDESLLRIERTGQRCWEAEVNRLKGELLLAQNGSNPAQAEQSFRTAIEVSRGQHAKSWELRATISLARFLATAGKLAEARPILAEIRNWFTEGLDTPDLKDAKALLDQLGM